MPTPSFSYRPRYFSAARLWQVTVMAPRRARQFRFVAAKVVSTELTHFVRDKRTKLCSIQRLGQSDAA
jgi:hypothetical protein